MKKKLPEEYKSRQIKSIFYTILLHVVLIFIFSLVKFYPQSEESTPSSQGMELNYASFIEKSEEELIPIETVSEDDIEDIIPAPSEDEETTEEVTNQNISSEGSQVEKQNNSKEEKEKNSNPENSKSEDTKEDNDRKQIDNQKGVTHGFSNWEWDTPPDIQQDKVSEGYIVFQVFLDKDGNVIEAVETDTNISDRNIKKIYQNAVLQTRFHPTSSEEEASKNTLGEIKFIIKSK